MSETPAASAPIPRALSLWWAFAWGLAEATFFFIVPDVLFTRIALRDFRRALVAAVYALAGALVGGLVVWLAVRNGGTAWLLNAFTQLPGVNASLVSRTAEAWHHHGAGALFAGALSGQPYKLFAVHAAADSASSLSIFLLASAAARFSRFFLSTTISWLAGRLLSSRSVSFKLRFHAGGWALFYLIYFILMH